MCGEPVQNVGNLSCRFENNMSMNIQIGKISTKAFLRAFIRQVRNSFLSNSLQRLYTLLWRHILIITTLSCSKLAITNFKFLNGFPIRLLELPVLHIDIPMHITFVFMHFHWLPVKFRIYWLEICTSFVQRNCCEKPDCCYQLISDDQELVFFFQNVTWRLHNIFRFYGFRFFFPRLLSSGICACVSVTLEHVTSSTNSKTIECFKSQLKTFLRKLWL